MADAKLPNVGRPGFPSLAALLGARLGGATAMELWTRLEQDEPDWMMAAADTILRHLARRLQACTRDDAEAALGYARGLLADGMKGLRRVADELASSSKEACMNRDDAAVLASESFVELFLLDLVEGALTRDGDLPRIYGSPCPGCYRIHDRNPDAAARRAVAAEEAEATDVRARKMAEVDVLISSQHDRARWGASATHGKDAHRPDGSQPSRRERETAATEMAKAASTVQAAVDGTCWFQLHCNRSHWLCEECFEGWARGCDGEPTCPLCRLPVRARTRVELRGINRYDDDDSRPLLVTAAHQVEAR